MALKSIHNTDIISNLDIISYYNENDELQLYEINPIDGYVVRVYALDEYVTDEENDKTYIRPYYTSGSVVPFNYDWQKNSNGYTAELYREGMEDEIIEAHPENNNTPELTEDIIEKAKAYDILMGASE